MSKHSEPADLVTPCCGACTSIGDDMVEYCKACYEPCCLPVQGVAREAVR